MKDKVSVATFIGMDNFGLVCRTVTSDLSETEDDISSISIISTVVHDKAPKL